MHEKIPQGRRGSMLGEPLTMAVPEKVRDDALVEILHSALPSLKPTA
jgi:hypothetical protein